MLVHCRNMNLENIIDIIKHFAPYSQLHVLTIINKPIHKITDLKNGLRKNTWGLFARAWIIINNGMNITLLVRDRRITIWKWQTETLGASYEINYFNYSARKSCISLLYNIFDYLKTTSHLVNYKLYTTCIHIATWIKASQTLFEIDMIQIWNWEWW